MLEQKQAPGKWQNGRRETNSLWEGQTDSVRKVLQRKSFKFSVLEEEEGGKEEEEWLEMFPSKGWNQESTCGTAKAGQSPE